ncbi:MAG: hypothetical protein ABI347_02790 [Nitrososphaera sp.]|jgi:hypothetical protein
MPKITFEKEVTQEQYDAFEVALKLEQQTADEYILGAVRRAIVATPESANESALAIKAGLYEDEEEGHRG